MRRIPAAPDLLQPIPFSASALAEVRHFDFGGEYYQRELLYWLVEESGAALQAGTRIWLYANARCEIVGFGALGIESWEIAGRDLELFVIPALALRREFWGQPAGLPPEQRYAQQIVEHLIRSAIEWKRPTAAPNRLVLLVHPKNARAIGLYRRLGFRKFSYTYTVPGTRKKYESYALALRQER